MLSRSRRSVAILLTAVLLAGCANAPGVAEVGDELPLGALEEETGLAHVHGLGVNPADGSLLIATHFGLWRIPAGADGAERVGAIRHDLMGFAVVGPDHLVASGHPILDESLPALLGLIESRDGGLTWRSVSLLGEVDFHALHAAHGRLYGWDSASGRLLVSTDGERWDERGVHRNLIDLVVDPTDAEHLLITRAAGDALQVARSRDGGRSFDPVATEVGLVQLFWDGDALWGSAPAGDVWRSADAGESWTLAGRSGVAAEALHAAGDVVVVAQGGTVRRSSDGGATWVTVHADPPTSG